jgi:hypothetical protein
MQRSAAYRFLLAAVILLGVLIVIALGVLVVGFAMRFRHAPAPDASAPAQFTLAAGSRIISADVSGDRLVLRLKGSFGDELDIIDIQSGRLVAKVRSAAPPKKQ